jgi:predicted nucleic acid-binding protein
VVYLDTSSLLKLIWPELDSELVAERVSRETLVLISSLTELEGSIQITAGYLRGRYSLPRSRLLHKELNNLLQKEPFERRVLSGGIFEAARIQHTRHGVTSFCRTLDRLHLAAMEELGLTRLITNDPRQADAARALGFTVAVPA